VHYAFEYDDYHRWITTETGRYCMAGRLIKFATKQARQKWIDDRLLRRAVSVRTLRKMGWHPRHAVQEDVA
jgi:hypothetical protein